MKLSTLFSLERQYSFYRHYHTNSTNRRIHYFFVPVLLITAFALLSEISLPAPAHTVAHVAVFLYMLHAFLLSPLLGLLYTPFLLAYLLLSQLFHDSLPPDLLIPVALFLHFLSWIAQFAGHYIYEKRSPAVFNSFFQAISSGPIVLWLELLFAAGFLPDLKAQLHRAPAAAKARKAVASRQQ